MKHFPRFLQAALILTALTVPPVALRAQDTAPSAPPVSVLDFGDHTSATLVGRAWQAMEGGRFADAEGYASKCIELYQRQAVDQQISLQEPVPAANKEEVFKLWALNDVGTAYFIRGQAREKLGNGPEALQDYKYLVSNLPFAQCWDVKGWFWKPADGAGGRIKQLEFDAIP